MSRCHAAARRVRGGLQLTERYAGWARQPFDAASAQHVSVYQRT